ncbi:diguanylate cyclase domain-containing protein [Pseudomonas sp.]|uniref:diguanylate cyclase domain-containing protein n=1 Tax=Pseudomonas sp. TaxID=306 RepID=UPI002736B546|nr:diguanylate cyclase [Pseudomonas sp.]MDP3816133.1 diguanylate cyclase [Pseudomonas sp.]
MPFFRRRLDQGLDLFQRHAVLGMTLVLLLSLSGLTWSLQQIFTQQLQNAALKNAQLYTATLSEFRSLYTSEVVARARQYGMTITHDYQTTAQAIPLPATLSMLLGNRLTQQGSGASTRLYSPYPFPWRAQEGGLRDSFGEQAWQALQADPKQPFYRFERLDDQLVLRYATADLMREACVDCHNSHPESPRRGWRVGDLRGILEVKQPLDSAGLSARPLLIETAVVTLSILALFSTLLALVIGRLHRAREEAQCLSQEMGLINRALEREVVERHQAEQTLRTVNETLLQLTNRDPLTQIANRRCFEDSLALEWKRAQRLGSSIGLIMVDIDHFKAYNDHYGHQAGDRCLQRVAALLQSMAQRSTDLVARYGGEEFVIVLPNTPVEAALALAEAMRKGVEALQLEHAASPTSAWVTLSLGAASLIPGADSTPEQLLQIADRALYRAKAGGRNRCEAGAAE